jgi:hypothetical protein
MAAWFPQVSDDEFIVKTIPMPLQGFPTFGKFVYHDEPIQKARSLGGQMIMTAGTLQAPG